MASDSSLFTPLPTLKEVAEEFGRAAPEARGAVYTKGPVARFVLDLVGYADAPEAPRDLAALRLLEPGCGDGAFLVPAAERLLASYLGRGGTPARAADDLAGALLGIDNNAEALDAARGRLRAALTACGLSEADAERLADGWLSWGDFLLMRVEGPFDVVVGNPPYVRQENVPGALLAEYRRRYRTVYDRADLYVPFYEAGLRLLAPGSRLAFISPDRWLKNRYGGPLRALIADGGFRLLHHVDLQGAPAFDADVIAYAAVFTVERGAGVEGDRAGAPTLTASVTDAAPGALRALALALTAGPGGDGAGDGAQGVAEVRLTASGGAPWVARPTEAGGLLERLEAAFPLLEETGARVGIGVATGADRVFIRPERELPVEPTRRLPVALSKDVRGGVLRWSGHFVLNPFDDDGRLVDLDAHPRLKAYLHAHEGAVRKRNVAKRNPTRWYRTIDRIWPELTARPKLLIPDIKGGATVAYDAGTVYPHHNLYYVVADGDGAWDLRALQAVLRSAVAEYIVDAYAVRMQGGFLRFQAQYVRRVRLPRWADVPGPLRERLAEAAEGERQAADEAAAVLYGLTPQELDLVTRTVEEARRAPRPR